MIKVVVAVKDRLTGYKSLMLEDNENVAKRQFKLALRQTLHIDKSDFELVSLGSFDTDTGKFQLLETSVLLMTGNEVESNVSNAV